MKPDQVFDLAPRTVKRVLDLLGAAIGESGNGEADIEAKRDCLDALHHPAFVRFSGSGRVDNDRIGMQYLVAGKTEHLGSGLID